MEDIEALFQNEGANLCDLKKETQVAGGDKVYDDSGGFQLIHNVFLLVEKVEAVELEAALVMHTGRFGNQFFGTTSSQAFDEVENFYLVLSQNIMGWAGAANCQFFLKRDSSLRHHGLCLL
jgi:hypothetical protein